jgi:hypothetical protein
MKKAKKISHDKIDFERATMENMKYFSSLFDQTEDGVFNKADHKISRNYIERMIHRRHFRIDRGHTED